MLSIITNNAASLFDNQTFQDFELVANNPNGEFVLTIDEDVEFKPTYLEQLLEIFQLYPEVGMVYSNGSYPQKKLILRPTDSKYLLKQPYRNFLKVIYNGASIPTKFGIFRREVWKQLKPERNFNSFKAGSNDFRMAKFFLHGNKLKFINKQLFKTKPQYYKFTNSNASINNIVNWTVHIQKQLDFYTEICSEIDKIDSNEVLKLLTIDSCLNRTIPIFGIILQDVTYDAFEYSIIRELVSQLTPIHELRIKNGNITKQDRRNIQLRLKILNEKILEFIKSIVQDETIVKSTIEKVNSIQSSFQQ